MTLADERQAVLRCPGELCGDDICVHWFGGRVALLLVDITGEHCLCRECLGGHPEVSEEIREWMASLPGPPESVRAWLEETTPPTPEGGKAP